MLKIIEYFNHGYGNGVIMYIYIAIYVLKESEMIWKWRKEEKTYIAV